MKVKPSFYLAHIVLMSLMCLITALPIAAQEMMEAPATIEELERELTGIEEELLDLESRIDSMLGELVDPRITSLSVFFSSSEIRGRTPNSIQLILDGDPLTAREFSETERLILLRGGALEVYAGISDPALHTLIVVCALSSGTSGADASNTAKAAFEFENKRSAANFLEITLAEDLSNKSPDLVLSARHWSKEP